MKIINDELFRKIISKEEPAFDDEILLFKDCGQIIPIFGSKSYTIVFKNCTTALFDNTNKEFNFYWINSMTFPKLEKIYLNGLFPEGHCYKRFLKETWILVDVFDADNTKQIRQRKQSDYYYNIPDNYETITHSDFMSVIENYKKTHSLESYYDILKRKIKDLSSYMPDINVPIISIPFRS